MNFFKEQIKKMVFKEKYSSESYINFLRKKGATIGHNCTIYYPRNTIIDYQNTFMINIGNNVKIADGVRILTHDFSLSVIANIYDEIIGSVRKVTIGNNVFIGMNATILAGTVIEDNVIIGAGAVVSGKCKNNSVYAGNPAKRIESIDELYKKRKNKEIENAKELARTYYIKTGKIPTSDVLREYSMLFLDKSQEIPANLRKIMIAAGALENIQENISKKDIPFKDINDFIEHCNLK